MLSFLQSAFNSQDTHTTVTIQTVPAGLQLSFEYKTVFKTLAFEILLERQPTNTETRFEQAARSLHQQLVVAQNEIQRLGAENAALKLEIDKVWKVLRSPLV